MLREWVPERLLCGIPFQKLSHLLITRGDEFPDIFRKVIACGSGVCGCILSFPTILRNLRGARSVRCGHVPLNAIKVRRSRPGSSELSVLMFLSMAGIGTGINAFRALPDFKRVSICQPMAGLNGGRVVGVEGSHDPRGCSVGIQDANLVIAQCKSSGRSGYSRNEGTACL